MDSVTQFALGAAIGGAVGGKSLGRKALLIGGVLATLPDLDVFYPFDDSVSLFTYHRGVSHSLIVLTLVSPLFAVLINTLAKKYQPFKQTLWLVWLCLFTHPLLDGCTIYGTQWFWPFMPSPTMIGSLFIIDPLYTIPLLIGFFALLIKPQSRKSTCVNHWGLMFSTAYLVLSLCLQQYVIAKAKAYADQNKIEVQRILATPTPFTISAWRVVVVNQQSYYEGFYGLLPYTREFNLIPYERRLELTEFVKNTWAFKRLEWFTSGFYKLGRENDKIYMSDLRMGMEPGYSFSFYVAKREGYDYVEIPNERHRTTNRRKISDIGKFWCEKIWKPTVGWCND